MRLRLVFCFFAIALFVSISVVGASRDASRVSQRSSIKTRGAHERNAGGPAATRRRRLSSVVFSQSTSIHQVAPACANGSTIARAAAASSAGVLPSVTISKAPACGDRRSCTNSAMARISSGVGRGGKPLLDGICGMIPSWRSALATLLGRVHTATTQIGIPGR